MLIKFKGNVLVGGGGQAWHNFIAGCTEALFSFP